MKRIVDQRCGCVGMLLTTSFQFYTLTCGLVYPLIGLQMVLYELVIVVENLFLWIGRRGRGAMAVNSEAYMVREVGCNVLNIFWTLEGAVDRAQGIHGCKY